MRSTYMQSISQPIPAPTVEIIQLHMRQAMKTMSVPDYARMSIEYIEATDLLPLNTWVLRFTWESDSEEG